MKAHARSHRRHDHPAPKVHTAVLDQLSPGVGGPASANEERALASEARRSRVDPLWMIAVAMAFTFALLGLLTST